jgi:transcriptional regulator with XRE-family HTH domain
MEYQAARQRFGARLRAVRAEKGVTQEQLAEMVAKTTEHISFLERGERAPSFELILDIAGVLDVSVAYLMSIDEQDNSKAFVENLATIPIAEALPDPIQETPADEGGRLSDIERLNRAFEGIRAAQRLAHEYGIHDILQDNGGKVLQLLILLGLHISPGREGNDAVDDEGNEYELKTVNRALNRRAGITTHHHLNRDILAKYRAVKAWYIAFYEGVELKEIYRLSPPDLEPLFQNWEKRIESSGPLNNPKIPLSSVFSGARVYPVEAATAAPDT